MDRTNATNYVVVNGKRRYSTGLPMTVIAPNAMSALEEEIVHVIESAGIAPDINNWNQLRLAILNMIPTVLPPPPNYTPAPISSTWPSFEAKMSANQTYVGDDVLTKVNFNVETVDTNNNYNIATMRFQPSVAGIYLFGFHIFCDILADTIHRGGSISIFKNGAMYRNSNMPVAGLADNAWSRGHNMITLASANGTTDYFEAYVSQNGDGDPSFTIWATAGSYPGIPVTYWYGARVG